MYAPFFPLWVIIYIISHFFNICKGSVTLHPVHVPMCVPHIPLYDAELAIRSWEQILCRSFFNCVTLHPVHVFVLRTHSVRTGSLLSHTKEIKSVIYIQSCVRPQNMKHPIKHYGRTHGCATTIGHFLYSVHYFNPSAIADTTITHYELCITH